jgi:hypothetical protein
MARTPDRPAPTSGGRPAWFAESVRLVVAPLVLFLSGFFMTQFLLSGEYTWPKTSRALILSLTIAVLAYEFVYKEQRGLCADGSDSNPSRAVLYSCVLPYVAGALSLLALLRRAA